MELTGFAVLEKQQLEFLSAESLIHILYSV